MVTAADLAAAFEVIRQAGREDIRAMIREEFARQAGPPAAWLDSAAFGELHGITSPTVCAYAAAGRIPGAERVGRRWRFPAGATIAPAVRPEPIEQDTPQTRARRALAADRQLRSVGGGDGAP